eukprot:gene34163-biopygen17133
MHLALEAVYKTGQSFLRELTGKVRVYWPVDKAWYTGTVGDTGADSLTHVAHDDGDEEYLNMSKENSLTELAVQMQGATLGSKAVGNFQPKARASMAFCEAEGRQWLPATETTMRLYIAHQLDKGTVQAANMQP